MGGALVVALATVALPLAGPASAEPDYPPKFNKITASSFTVLRTGSITFKAQTFESGSTVDFGVSAAGTDVAGGSAAADAKGVVVQDIRFDVVGTNVVSFSGTSSKGEPLTLSAQITVTDPAAGGSGDGDGSGDSDDEASSGGGIPLIGGLPRTGGDILLTVVVAGALVGGGALLLAASRRRRSAA
jgi:LPXTG-motif cell wall-anchored protein